MDPAPRISVLIPVYNREGTIGECVHSAIDQTWRDLEVVISDNRSSDGTWAICESMAQRDARIRLVRNERNLGPVRNWKRCLDEARGELAILLFSDDSLRPQFLEKAAPYLDDPEVGLAFAAVTHGPAPERGRLLYTWGGREGKVSSRRFLCDAMVHNGALPCSPGATLFRLADLRKNLSTEIPSPSMRDFAGHGAGPDLLLLLRTAAQYAAVAHLSQPLAHFRDHAHSISREIGEDLLAGYYAQARLSFASGQSDPQWLNRAFGGYWLRRIKTARAWVGPEEIEAKFLMPGMRHPKYARAFWYGITNLFGAAA